ncbi:MAG: LacI family transcriptional regulator, partial [Atopostipes sp.]|nr:LacI family transcriptional regulator [Atopostipes sp.]
MVTIEDVAKKANTSIATVSRVLNQKGGYSERTEETVNQAIDELNYESNAIARSLKKRKTNTVGVLVPNVSSMLANEILTGIEKYASKNNYSVLTSHTYTEREKVMKSLKTFQEQRVDGL